jgi:uncharacterized protein YndB with AHSA1/START domain
MIRYELEERIRRSPAAVYDFVAVHQPENHPKWEDEVVEIRREAPLAVGTKGVMVRQEGKRRREVPFEVTALVPDRLIAFRSGAGGFDLRLTFDLRPAGDETDFHVTAELNLSGPLRLFTPIFRRKFPQTGARITKKLASLLNAQA